MAGRVHEISPPKAAQILGVNVKTVRAWYRAVRRGEGSKLRYVRVDAGGRYWLLLSEVRKLAENHEKVDS